MIGPQTHELRILLSFIQPLVGALVLLWFYFWLKTRQAKDTSLFWLFLTLITAALPGLIRLATPGSTGVWLIYGFASPLCNAIMTMTAFRLLRVKEAIRHNERLRWWPLITQWTVVVGSIAVTLLVVADGGYAGLLLTCGLKVDAVVSLIALTTMAICLSYSFYKYGNQPFIVLTLADFIYIASYQFELASRSGVLFNNQVLAALNVTSVSVMTMLFIALTLSWVVSHASHLQFKDSDAVLAIVMFIDLRGSTQWAKDMADGKYVVTFMNKFTHWTLSRASEQPYGSPSVKFTGDGLMFVWEITDPATIIERANAVVGLSCALCSGYESWVKSKPELYQGVPRSVGIGVDFGSAISLTSESGSYEYIGLPANYAAKFQGLARPDGGVVIRDNWVLTDELRERFVRKGKVEIAGELIPVRATSGVKLLVPPRNGGSGKNGSAAT